MHTIAHHCTPLHTIAHHCTPLHTIAHHCTPLHTHFPPYTQVAKDESVAWVNFVRDPVARLHSHIKFEMQYHKKVYGARGKAVQVDIRLTLG